MEVWILSNEWKYKNQNQILPLRPETKFLDIFKGYLLIWFNSKKVTIEPYDRILKINETFH